METNLEETLQPPHLENALSNDNSQLEDAPPFDTAVCAFGSVPVHSFTNNNVSLLILYLRDSIGKLAN